MKDNDQCDAIAKACGLVLRRRGLTQILASSKTPFLNAWATRGGWEGHPPNYTGDLNAMNEAEASLTTTQHNQYRDILMQVLIAGAGGTPEDYARAYVSADAQDRAEAFLRALGLWRD